MTKVLTDIAIRNLKPGAKRREIPDPVHGALRRRAAVRQEFVRGSLSVRGKPRKLTLPAGLSLKAARKAAGDALYEVEQGRDPSATKRQRKRRSRSPRRIRLGPLLRST